MFIFVFISIALGVFLETGKLQHQLTLPSFLPAITLSEYYVLEIWGHERQKLIIYPTSFLPS